jgi:hypothetical protein
LARRSLKPQLNQIRTWVRQGRTDAWIAHQLEVSVREVASFKREHELAPGETEGVETDLFGPRVDEDEEREATESGEPDESPEDSEGDGEGKPRRRGRRGGRGRKRGGGGRNRPLEGTFDHGDEGYGLWLDPAIQDDPVYAEHWAGHRPVTVTVEADRIVISRLGGDDSA